MSRYLLISVALIMIATASQAETIIPGGNVVGTWTLAGSPYIITTADITLLSGDTLVIEPGVQVRFDQNLGFTIQANSVLIAAGTATDSIRFTSNALQPQQGDWNGLQVPAGAPPLNLSYCALEYGDSIKLDRLSSSLSHCRLSIPLATTGEPNSLHLTNCLVTVDLNFDVVSHTFFTSSTFLGSINYINSCHDLHIDSCAIHGNLTFYTMLGNLYVNNSTLYGNYDGRDDDESLPHFTNCVIYGAMTGVSILHLNHCTTYGPIIAESLYESPSMFLENGCIINGPFSAHSYNVTSSGTIFLTPVHLSAGHSTDISGGVFCDSLYGSLGGMGHLHLANNLFLEGSVNLSGSVDPFGNSTVENNLVVNSPTNGLRFAISGSEMYGPFTLRNNTITGSDGHGLLIVDANPGPTHEINVLNNIVAGNDGYGISVATGDQNLATYNDVYGNSMGDYLGVVPGAGSISVDPEFVDVDLGECRLKWGSPCIDTGEPTLTDPDNTRRDMGAFFFDQNKPVRLLLTPHGQLVQIIEAGGSFSYDLRLTNIATMPQTVTAWCNVTLPSGAIYGPTIGPVQVTIQPEVTLSRLRTQMVPGSAPPGLYKYNGYAVVGADTFKDSFVFIKHGSGIQSAREGFGGWSNTGEAITADYEALSQRPSAISLACASPNPFNYATAISYQLSQSAPVLLTIHDVQGRLVVKLVDEVQQAGMHQTIFDGSALGSGIYWYTLSAGPRQVSGKLALIK